MEPKTTKRRGSSIEAKAPDSPTRTPISTTVVVMLGVALGLAFCVFGDYVRVMIRDVQDAGTVVQLESRLRSLQRHNATLERQLESASERASDDVSKNTDVSRRIDELQAVVEASTALGLFTKKQSDLEPRNGRKSARNAPAGRRGNAVGGAEIECRRDKRGHLYCISNTYDEVSTRDVRASLAPAVMALDGTEGSDVNSRLDRAIFVMAALPIGAPVKGDLTSGFGYRRSPFSGHMSLHEGVDLSHNEGEPILATGGGIVERIEYHRTYGWMVDIRHTRTLVTRYAHLKKVLTREGRRVRRGDKIALLGSTGRSTGPHLHYEVLVNNRPRNPMPFIQLASKLTRFRDLL